MLSARNCGASGVNCGVGVIIFELRHVGDGERTAYALECEGSDFPDIRCLGDCSGNSGRNQNLAVRGGLAQARGSIDDRTDRTVVEAPLEADLPEGCKALRNANAEPDLMATLAPGPRERGHGVPHVNRKADGALRRVGTW